MPVPQALSDADFLAAVLACRLEADAFDHCGHLRAAWLLLQRHPLETAIAETCNAISALARALGAGGKYHRTTTEALVRLMAHGGATDRQLSWPDFLAANAMLLNDARNVLARHYSDVLLDDPSAREQFLPPDRQPLPA